MDINLSLDDIIKKKSKRPPKKPLLRDNVKKLNTNKFKGRQNGSKQPINARSGITDARLKIQRKTIMKKLANTVTDARNKIKGNSANTVVDARLRLEALRRRQEPLNAFRAKSVYRPQRVVPAASGASRLFQRAIPSSTMDTDELEDEPLDGTLTCTVRNDNFGRKPVAWDRPVDDEEMVSERLHRSTFPQRDFMSDDPDLKRLTLTVKNQSGPMSILKRPPTHTEPRPSPLKPPHRSIPETGPPRTLSERFCREQSLDVSARMKAMKAYMDNKSSYAKAASSPPVGHRIIVSNLLPSVSNDDVKELFGDIGELIYSKIVRPGIAEVVYENYEDALKAVDVYHDRQLDDQPMKCLLVKNQQGPSKKLRRPAEELDMEALRNALHKVYS